MVDNDSLKSSVEIPVELQQTLPRRVRPAGWVIFYFAFNMLLSAGLVTIVVLVGSLTPKEIRESNDLQRDGRLAYANNVRVTGMRSSTVSYTFTYNGKSYSGKAFLPSQSEKSVEKYAKTGNLPILFLPTNPLINHPFDWKGSGPFPFFGYIFGVLIVVQWIVFIRFILSDLRKSDRPEA
jgi:hypothetical protein